MWIKGKGDFCTTGIKRFVQFAQNLLSILLELWHNEDITLGGTFMKKRTRQVLTLFVTLILAAGCLLTPASAREEEGKTATILFTHDMHSHLLPAEKEGGGEYGGFARLMTVLEQERAQAAASGYACITVDGGDFSMGTLFQTIYTTRATELRSLGALGYDAATFGNHEYEYRADGLAKMLRAAAESGDPLPALVQTNYVTPKDPEAGAEVVEAMAGCGVTDYVIIERDGVRFAVFGVMGEDADACAPMSGMEFEPVIQAAQRVVDEIKANEAYDFLICLSHSGTNPDPKKSEDELLAKNVDGIDFIVSGHTHSTMLEPKIVNNTVIGCTGEYCTNLGKVTIKKDAEGNNAVLDYELIPIDENVAEDPRIAAQVADYKELVETEYLSQFGMTFDQVLAHSPFDFTPISQFAQKQEEDSLGNLITDAYIYAVRQAEAGTSAAPITAAFVNSGVIRSSFSQGDITVSDAFNVSSIGSGADGSPGYPLIDAWLTGKELKTVLELDPSVGPLFSGVQLYSSGVRYTFNMHRMLFNRVTEPAILSSDGGTEAIDDNKLYRVVTNLYSSQMLGMVTDLSYGILKITPKDEWGNPITNYEDHIIHLEDGSELKEWYAVATYLASFPPEDGVPQVPQRYAGPEGRKVRDDSVNPIALLRQPNWITLTVLGVALLLAALVVFIIYRVATRKRRRSRRSGIRRGYRSYRG